MVANAFQLRFDVHVNLTQQKTAGFTGRELSIKYFTKLHTYYLPDLCGSTYYFLCKINLIFTMGVKLL